MLWDWNRCGIRNLECTFIVFLVRWRKWWMRSRFGRGDGLWVGWRWRLVCFMNGVGTQKIAFCGSLLRLRYAAPAVNGVLVCSGSCVYGSLNPLFLFFSAAGCCCFWFFFVCFWFLLLCSFSFVGTGTGSAGSAVSGMSEPCFCCSLLPRVWSCLLHTFDVNKFFDS